MLLEIRNDEAGVGSVDFGKLIPMPEALNIEAGSRTNDGLKAYNDFIAVYALGRDPNTLDLLNIPAESEEAFLRQRTDIDRTVWELGRAAFQNQQRYVINLTNGEKVSTYGAALLHVISEWKSG